MNKSQTVSVGIFFLIGLALLWIVQGELSSNGARKSSGYEVVAKFETLLQLRVGDDVRMSGVRIGTVQYTGLQNRIPTARFLVDADYEIPVDSVASIGMAGLLGNNLVSIQMGDADVYIKPDGEIKTRTGFDINNVVNEIGNLSQRIAGAFDNFDKLLGFDDDEESIFEVLSGLLKDNRESVGNIMRNLDTVTAQIASGEGTIGKLVMEEEMYKELQAVSADLKTTLAEAEALLTDTRDIVNHVKQGEGTLGNLIYGESNITAEIEALLADLRGFSQMLNNPDSTVGRLLSDDQLYGELQNIMRKANQTLDSIGDAAPISAIGAVASPLF